MRERVKKKEKVDSENQGFVSEYESNRVYRGTVLDKCADIYW